jgi:hypothetical protein
MGSRYSWSSSAPFSARRWTRSYSRGYLSWCNSIFENLIAWLQSKGVTAKTPLHTLRMGIRRSNVSLQELVVEAAKR